MIRKLLFVFLAASLCACSQPVSPPAKNASEPSVVQEEHTQRSEVLFLVDPGMDPAYLRAAENFARNVATFTDGELEVRVGSISGAEMQFALKNAEFIYIRGADSRANSAYMEALSMPFLYPDYNVFTMAANKSEVLRVLEDDVAETMKARFLGAFYSQSNHLLSIWQPASQELFDDANIRLGEDSGAAGGFSMLGANTAIEAQSELRVQGLLKGTVQGAEFTLEELAGFDWTDTDFYFTYTYHSLKPVWLVTAPDFYDGLSAQHKAAVQEAMAMMYHDIDQNFLQVEQEQVDQLKRQGVLIYGEFSSARGEIMNMVLDEEDTVNSAQKYVMELVRTLE